MASLALLAACSSGGATPVLGVHEPGQSSADVELSGVLVVEKQCVMLRSSGDDLLMLAWPQGFEVGTESGKSVVLNTEGQSVGAVGDQVRLSGGPIAADDIRTDSGDSLPDGCSTDHAFAVSSVLD